MKNTSKKIEYEIRNRIWICTEKGTFIGEGRITLLRKIEETGSISKAAKSMQMSYRKAWDLVNSMNEQSLSPLVLRTKGGKGGGGTTLTATGRKAISLFDQINKKCKALLEAELKQISFILDDKLV